MKTINDYADLVKEQHALNTTIAPVETDLTSASQAYAVGQKFIYDGVRYQAKTAIAQGAALVLNTNYEAADDVSSEIEALTKEVAATLNTLGAKNFLETLIGSGTTQGVTYTINADGSITLNGTCTAWTNIKLDYIAGQKNIPSGSYILNGSISGNNKFRLNTYVDGTKMAESENGNEASFTIPSTATEVYTRFEIDSTATFNNETFYPMIRLSSIEDDTYAPYAKTNRKLTAENQTLTNNLSDEAETRAELGAHNICPFNIANIKANNTAGSWNGNTYTVSGLTFIVNNDGTVTISGNSLGTVYFSYYTNANGLTFMEDGKAYILSGAPSSLAAANGYLYLNKSPEIASRAGGETEFTYASSVGRTQVIIVIVSGADLTTPITLKPMIRLATDSDSTYQPYAMTNKELTENYNIKTAVVSVPATYHGGSVANINFEKRNGVVRAYWAGGTPTFPAQGTEYEIGDIPEGFIPSQVQTGYGVDMNSFVRGMYLQLRTNGKIYIFGYNTGTGGTVNALVSLVYFA